MANKFFPLQRALLKFRRTALASCLATPHVKPFMHRGTGEPLLWTELMTQRILVPLSRKGEYQTFGSVLGSYYGITRQPGKPAIALRVVYTKDCEGP